MKEKDTSRSFICHFLKKAFYLEQKCCAGYKKVKPHGEPRLVASRACYFHPRPWHQFYLTVPQRNVVAKLWASNVAFLKIHRQQRRCPCTLLLPAQEVTPEGHEALRRLCWAKLHQAVLLFFLTVWHTGSLLLRSSWSFALLGKASFHPHPLLSTCFVCFFHNLVPVSWWLVVLCKTWRDWLHRNGASE